MHDFSDKFSFYIYIFIHCIYTLPLYSVGTWIAYIVVIVVPSFLQCLEGPGDMQKEKHPHHTLTALGFIHFGIQAPRGKGNGGEFFSLSKCLSPSPFPLEACPLQRSILSMRPHCIPLRSNRQTLVQGPLAILCSGWAPRGKENGGEGVFPQASLCSSDTMLCIQYSLCLFRKRKYWTVQFETGCLATLPGKEKSDNPAVSNVHV